MKHFLIFLISLGFMAGLVACTPTVVPEVAYVAVPTMPTQDMAVPPPALVFVTAHPTRVVSTATAVPTETAAATATAVPPTMPARETPTNVAVTPSTAISIGVSPISPTIELTRAVAITATVPTSNTLPNAQTPTPGWHYYVSDPHGLMMQIPAHWLLSPDFMYRLEGSDGFVELLATNSQDNVLLNACQDMAMGTAVPVEWLTAAGQEACLVTADDGSVATLIVQFPELRENIVPGVAYAFLVLQADPAHMPGFVQTLYFLPGTAVP